MFRPWHDSQDHSCAGASPATARARQQPSKMMRHPDTHPTSVQKGSGVAQQQQAGAPIPSMAVPEPTAAPPKNPFHTRSQLPRTPLSSKKGNHKGSSIRNAGSRARSASSPAVTKIPRSSHFARSASPAPKPAGLSTPTSRADVVQGAGAGTGATIGENLSVVTTPVADTKQIEEEMLAAFARTPKVARTPPKGSAPSAPADAASAVAVSSPPVGEQLVSDFSTGQLSALPPAAAAGEDGLPQQSRGAQHQPGHAASLPVVRVVSQLTPVLPEAAATAPVAGVRDTPPGENSIGSRDAAPAPAESAAELVFGRSAILARTPPRSSDEIPGNYGKAGNSAAGERQQQQQQQRGRPQGIGLPPAVVQSGEARRVAGRSVLPTAPAEGDGARGSPSRFASPSMSLDSSYSNTANVRNLAGSASSKTADVAGGGGRAAPRGRTGAAAENCGALTPAAFKGLISVMRTPSTGIKRPDALVSEVRCWENIMLLYSNIEDAVRYTLSVYRS